LKLTIFYVWGGVPVELGYRKESKKNVDKTIKSGSIQKLIETQYPKLETETLEKTKLKEKNH